jgi:hypothetical protein
VALVLLLSVDQEDRGTTVLVDLDRVVDDLFHRLERIDPLRTCRPPALLIAARVDQQTELVTLIDTAVAGQTRAISFMARQ